MRSAEELLSITSQLDARFYLLRDGMERSKDRSLRELVRILDEGNVVYALIGGLALQFWRREPRTTLDIDLAVRHLSDVPHAELEAAGFQLTGQFLHSQNWKGPDGTPVQFSDDPGFAHAIATAGVHPMGPMRLRVISVECLTRAKLRAAADPARRRSKRLQDWVDACGLVEDHPEIADHLSEAERAALTAPPGPPA